MNITEHYASKLSVSVETFMANALIPQHPGEAPYVVAWNEELLGPRPSDDDLAAVLALPDPPEDVAAAKAALCADIDRQAQARRDKYVTPGGAQAATYLFKQSQAQAAQAAQAADAGKTQEQLAALYPYLANEIGITADPQTNAPAADVYGVMRAVLATVLQWQPINLAIEATRLRAKAAIGAASTAATAQAAHDQVAWPGA